jgi:hypothetical protein
MTWMPSAVYRSHQPGEATHAQAISLWNKALIALILCSFYMNLPVYIFKLDNSLLPKYFYFAFVLTLAPMVLMRMGSISSYITSPFVIWAIALVLLNVLHLLSGVNAIEHRISQLILTRIQTLVMILLIGYVFSTMRASAYQFTFVLLAVVAPAILVTDFLFPDTLYSKALADAVEGRAGGTFINPNDAASSLLVIFVLACPVVPKKYRVPLLLLCGIGILVTFSRAAMLGWAFVWMVLAARRRVSAIGALGLLGLFMVPLAMGTLEAYMGTRSELSSSIENLEQRLAFLSKNQLGDDSSQARLEVLEIGWKKFLNNPVTGIGAATTSVGVTEDWPYAVNTHNQLMSLATEYGIAGIVLWCWLGILLMRGRFFPDPVMRMCGVLLFLLMTFFTHNMFDFPFWLMTFSLLAQRNSMASADVRPANSTSGYVVTA